MPKGQIIASPVLLSSVFLECVEIVNEIGLESELKVYLGFGKSPLLMKGRTAGV